MSLGAFLLSHDRRIAYNESNLIMMLYFTLKRELKQNTALWRLEICLKSRIINSRILKT